MSLVKHSLLRTAALAAVLGVAAAAAPSFAAPQDPTALSGPPNSTITFDSNGNVVQHTQDTSDMPGMAPAYGAAPAMAPQQQGVPYHHHMAQQQSAPASAGSQAPMAADKEGMKGHSPEEMKMHVEERIKNLHEKLILTKDEEGQWNDVAQAMRDNEANIARLVRERHDNGANMNAVDDLESYQAIAEAHADGLKKVNAAFKNLYASMPDNQKAVADKVFGEYEGHGQQGPAKHHHHMHPKPTPGSAPAAQ